MSYKKTDPLNITTNDTGYIVSNGSYKINKLNSFVVETDFSFSIDTDPNPIGPIMSVATANKDSYFRMYYTTYVKFEDYGLFWIFVKGYGKQDGYIALKMTLNVNTWHNLKLEKENNIWNVQIDDYDRGFEFINAIDPNADFNIYLGGEQKNTFREGISLTNIKINDKLVTCDNYKNDFTFIGNVDINSCPITDSIAINVPGKLKCLDSCKNRFLTSYTANIPVDKIQCCKTVDSTDLHGKDVGPNKEGKSPFLAYQSANDGNVQCIYDRNLIDNIKQVENALKIYKDQGKIIQDAFCESKTITDCPPEMKDGCSRYFAVNEEGDYCRDLFNKKSDEEKDISIFNYCTRNNTAECKCVNRVYDKDYLKLKENNPFLDSCWYIPCANSTRYLVPSEMKRGGECPENICQIVFDISQAHDVDIDHIKADINCDFSGSGKFPNHNVPWYYIVILILTIILLVIYTIK